jgi:hypothetical protein
MINLRVEYQEKDLGLVNVVYPDLDNIVLPEIKSAANQ